MNDLPPSTSDIESAIELPGAPMFLSQEREAGAGSPAVSLTLDLDVPHAHERDPIMRPERAVMPQPPHARSVAIHIDSVDRHSTTLGESGARRRGNMQRSQSHSHGDLHSRNSPDTSPRRRGVAGVTAAMSHSYSRARIHQHHMDEPPYEYPNGYRYLVKAMTSIDGSAYTVTTIGPRIADLLSQYHVQSAEEFARHHSSMVDDVEDRFTRRKTVEKALLSMRTMTPLSKRMLIQVAVTVPRLPSTLGTALLKSLQRIGILVLFPLVFPLLFLSSVLRRNKRMLSIRGFLVGMVIPNAVAAILDADATSGSLSANANARPRSRITKALVMILAILLVFAAFGSACICLVMWALPSLFAPILGPVPLALAVGPLFAYVLFVALAFVTSAEIPTHLQHSLAHFLRFYRLRDVNCTRRSGAKMTAYEVLIGMNPKPGSRANTIRGIVLMSTIAVLAAAIPAMVIYVLEPGVFYSTSSMLSIVIGSASGLLCLAPLTMNAIWTCIRQSREAMVIAQRLRNVASTIPLTTSENLNAWLHLRRHVHTVLSYSSQRLNAFSSMLMLVVILGTVANMIIIVVPMDAAVRRGSTVVSIVMLVAFGVLMLSGVLVANSMMTAAANTACADLHAVLSNAQWKAWASSTSSSNANSGLSMSPGAPAVASGKSMRTSQSMVTRKSPNHTRSRSHGSGVSGRKTSTSTSTSTSGSNGPASLTVSPPASPPTASVKTVTIASLSPSASSASAAASPLAGSGSEPDSPPGQSQTDQQRREERAKQRAIALDTLMSGFEVASGVLQSAESHLFRVLGVPSGPIVWWILALLALAGSVVAPIVLVVH